MKKFKKENLFLVVAILLLAGGGFFYLKKDKIPLYVIAFNQKQTLRHLEGTWSLEAVVDEESYTIKNRKSASKKIQKTAIERIEKNKLEFKDVGADKSYLGKISKIASGKDFDTLKEKVDGLVSIYSSTLYGDFNYSVLVDFDRDSAYLILNKEKNYLFWYENEELQILKKE